MSEKKKIRLVRHIYWRDGQKITRYNIEVLSTLYEHKWRNMASFATFFFALRAFNKLKQNKDAELTIIEEVEVVL